MLIKEDKMLRKEDFKKIVSDIENAMEEAHKIESVVPNLGIKFLDMSLIDTLIHTVELAMNMKENAYFGTILSWWIYDMKFGKDDARVTITENGEDKVFILDTADKLYDYLVKYESRN